MAGVVVVAVRCALQVPLQPLIITMLSRSESKVSERVQRRRSFLHLFHESDRPGDRHDGAVVPALLSAKALVKATY